MEPPLSYNLDPISFRSVGEKLLADEILSQEGRRDGDDGFLTRERLLQQLTRKFTNLRSLLRHSPPLQYAHQGVDLEAEYPKCPRVMMREHTINNSQLSLEDPTRQNIEYRRHIAARNALMRERELESGGGRGVFGVDKETQQWMEHLEAELARLGTTQGHSHLSGTSSPKALSSLQNRNLAPNGKGLPPTRSTTMRSLTPLPLTDMSHTSAARASTPSAALPDLVDAIPRISGSSSGSAASLVVQLKKSRSALNKLHNEHNIVKSILQMDANTALKNTITRMFADPRNAAAISQEEHERREREFQEERQRAAQYQNELLRDERESIERELAHFKA